MLAATLPRRRASDVAGVLEHATAAALAYGQPAETLIWITFRRPDGARTWYAWTGGGERLGDAVDRAAEARGLDAADWLHILDRHADYISDGHAEARAYPLRRVLADITAGVRGPEQLREQLARVLRASLGRQAAAAAPPPWCGTGPALLIPTCLPEPR